jgi:pterin-4a-carbinolamine dehydratase
MVQKLYETTKEFITGWKIDENHKKLYRNFFCEDYPSGIQFIKDIARMDAEQT